jgi:predicted ATP-grasp superfamily ATP-dependent carboligase
MIIQLRDRTEIVVTKEQAEKVKQAIQNDAKGIEIASEWFRADYVVRIKSGGEKITPLATNRQIEAPDHRGQQSEAKERLRSMLKEKGIIKPVDK